MWVDDRRRMGVGGRRGVLRGGSRSARLRGMSRPDPPRAEAVAAWVAALDAACGAACRLQGYAVIDTTSTLTQAQHDLVWAVAGPFAAGVAALVEACLQRGVDLVEILDLARQEGEESYQSRSG